MERSLSPKEEKALELIMQALDLMGWTMALPSAQQDGEPLYWLIVGTDEGVENAMKIINGEMQ